MTHLVIRGAYLREAFELAVHEAIDQAGGLFAVSEHARQRLGVDDQALSAELEEELRAGIARIQVESGNPHFLPNAFYRRLRLHLREHFDDLHRDHIAPYLDTLLRRFTTGTAGAAAHSHRRVLLNNLVPPAWLARLVPWRWSVHSVDDPAFILADCIAIARRRSAPPSHVPLVFGDDDDLAEIRLPLTSR